MWIEETRKFINSFTNFEELINALHDLVKCYDPDPKNKGFRIFATLEESYDFNGGLFVSNGDISGFLIDVRNENDILIVRFRETGRMGLRHTESKKIKTYGWIEPWTNETANI